MNEYFQQLLTDARRIWDQMAAGQRLLVAGVLVTTMGLFAFLVIWAQQPSFVTLYTKLSDQDAAAIVGKLKERNVQYELEGTTIRVPSNQVHEVRLALAGQGLPAGGNVGFGDLFNGTGNWTATDFERKLNYQRGLEGELARTIEAIEGVEKARVHIVIPKESLFIDEEQDTTASVLLTMDAMNKLEIPQVRTIQHMVAKAVPRLKGDQVFVTDTSGRDYTEEMAKLDPKNLAGTDLSARQLEIKKRYEKESERKIQAMLDSVLGPDNSVVRVNTVWDFSQQETNAETYVPSAGLPGGLLLSEKYKNETYNGAIQADGGVPGNNPNVQAPDYQATQNGNNGNYTNNEGTRNYNNNKEVQRRIKEPAKLTDTTVSVAFNPSMPALTALAGPGATKPQIDAKLREQTEKIQQMVGLAAGLPNWRNNVYVYAGTFNRTAELNANRDLAERERLAFYQRWGTVLAGLLVTFIVFGLMLSSFRRRRQEELQEIEEALPKLPTDDLGITLIDDDENLDDEMLPQLGMPSPDEQRLADMQRELAAFIKGQPKDAVKLVRAWIVEDE